MWIAIVVFHGSIFANVVTRARCNRDAASYGGDLAAATCCRDCIRSESCWILSRLHSIGDALSLTYSQTLIGQDPVVTACCGNRGGICASGLSLSQYCSVHRTQQGLGWIIATSQRNAERRRTTCLPEHVRKEGGRLGVKVLFVLCCCRRAVLLLWDGTCKSRARYHRQRKA